MTPRQLADAVAATRGRTDLRETAETLVFHAPLEGADRARWIDLRDDAPPALARVSIVLQGSDVDLERDMEPIEGERFRVTLRKTVEPGCLRLLMSASVAGLPDAVAAAVVVRVADMIAAQGFVTLGARFEPWTTDPVAAFAAAAALPDPRGIVKDFTPSRTVPSDVRPWLLVTGPTRDGAAYRAWSMMATERLMACIADEVSLDDRQVRFHFAGPPRSVVTPTVDQLSRMSDGVQAAARWVYAEGRDAEPRHLLLSTEWARALAGGQVDEVAERSLSSARTAYVAFVRSSSKETLKALAELRKGVVDETQKASQRAQDLAGGLWKDLAIASAPFVLKVLPDSARAGTSGVSVLLAWGAAAFLVYSFLVQTHINRRYFRTQRDGRLAWRSALGTILSASELEEFGEKPIRDSIRDYRFVRRVVGAIYAILVVGLVAFGIYELA
jgi:hypothetical protein